MAATQLITRCDIDAKWVKSLAVGENKGIYFIGVKEAKTDKDSFNIEELKSVTLELGIEVGLTSPITMQYITLDFSVETASDSKINDLTAMTRLNLIPESSLQVRVVNFTNKDGKIYKTGSMPVSINILKI